MIELKHLGKIYSSASGSVEALKDVNLTIADGEIFGIIGLSGAGMAILPSTLLGILPVGCLLSMRGALSAETFLSVIVLSFGVMQPLITAFSHTDDIAQAGLQYGKDQYDRERYAELRQIAAAADRMIAVTAAVRHIFRICMVPAPDFPASTRGKTFLQSLPARKQQTQRKPA